MNTKLQITTLFFIFLMLTDLSLKAQEKFELSAQIRPRMEMDGKDFDDGTTFNSFTALRSRLGASFKPNDDLQVFFQIQDSRYFGEETNTLSNSKNLDLHQGFFKISNFFDLPIDIKIGRMEINYGSQRLIGAFDWSNIGRSFDGGILTFRGTVFSIDAFGLQEKEMFLVGETKDRQIWGIYSDLSLITNYKIQPFVIWQRAIPSKTLNRFTMGFYVNSEVGRLVHTTEFAYQLGTVTPVNVEQDINAFMAALNFSYEFIPESKWTFSGGVGYFSGDDNSTDKNYEVFNTLYATNHKYYGYMDYFTDIPEHTYGLGLLDIHAGFSVNPHPRLTTALDLHMFNSTAPYKLAGGKTSKQFGNEADLTLIYKYRRHITFQGGLSLFSPGDIFKVEKGRDVSTWLYLMFVVNI